MLQSGATQMRRLYPQVQSPLSETRETSSMSLNIISETTWDHSGIPSHKRTKSNNSSLLQDEAKDFWQTSSTSTQTTLKNVFKRNCQKIAETIRKKLLDPTGIKSCLNHASNLLQFPEVAEQAFGNRASEFMETFLLGKKPFRFNTNSPQQASSKQVSRRSKPWIKDASSKNSYSHKRGLISSTKWVATTSHKAHTAIPINSKKTSLISIESVITVASEVTVPYIRTESKIGYVNIVLRAGESALTKSSKHWKEATNATCERIEKSLQYKNFICASVITSFPTVTNVITYYINQGELHRHHCTLLFLSNNKLLFLS